MLQYLVDKHMKAYHLTQIQSVSSLLMQYLNIIWVTIGGLRSPIYQNYHHQIMITVGNMSPLIGYFHILITVVSVSVSVLLIFTLVLMNTMQYLITMFTITLFILALLTHILLSYKNSPIALSSSTLIYIVVIRLVSFSILYFINK